ncbi:hypothetical protein FA13DRAFT_1426396 [Coprinellus micaceus]|uniref:Uncharacterized protein n=1 Tax=Coprinellus micaceus TaxID=71717 RepID=A0A4Y7TLX9_COPMI|nr:hypothetical protein FA13DRAFT_1426396 [Coprinellus micaceus]
MVGPSAAVPFAQYFTTNDAPSSQDLEAIRLYVSGPSKELGDVDHEIQHLTQRLTLLHSRRETLQNTVRKYTGICSPIRALPEDILGEIFDRCLPHDRLSVFHVNDAPFLLTAVCRRWRAVALQNPRLWTRFHVVTNMYNMDPPDYISPITNSRYGITAERHRATLQTCISRAGTLPLHFTLSDRTSYPPNNPSPIISYIGALFPRLQSLYWRPWLPFQKYLTSQPVGSFPLLEKITIYWATFNDFDPLNPPSYLLAPNLHDVQINGFNASPSILPLKWAQLTRLALPGTNCVVLHTELLELLRRCPKLREGIFYVSGEETRTCRVPAGSSSDSDSEPSSPPSRVSNPVSLPGLYSLDITHNDCIGNLLSHLRVPNLTKLALRGDRSESHMGFHVACLPMLLDNNEEPPHSIEELVIRPGVYLPQTIVKGLEQLPSLRTLVLVDKNGTSRYHPDTEKGCREEFDEDMLVRMTPRLSPFPAPDVDHDLPAISPPVCLCPLLERFEFRESGNYQSNRHLTLQAVVPFVSGKWEAAQRYPGRISALKHITVPSRTLPNESVKKALKPWRKEGLVVEFAHPGLDPNFMPGPYDDAWKTPTPDVVYW